MTSHRLVSPVLLGWLLLSASPASGQVTAVSGSVGNGGTPLHGAAVFLVALDRETGPAAPGRPVVVDQVHLRFVPGLVIVTPGTELRFTNSDALVHNVFGPGIRGGDTFDLGTYPEGEHEGWVFNREGIHVVLCHIHPEMVAYVVVTPSPYRAITAPDGTFEVTDVPPGRYSLNVWHPRRSRDTTTIQVEVPDQGVQGLSIRLGSSSTAVGGDGEVRR